MHTPSLHARLLRWLAVFSLASGLSCAVCSADNVLDQVLKKPGGFDQMCSESFIQADIPLPLFHEVERRMFFASGKSLDQLRANRKEVVPDLVHRLDAFDSEKTAGQFNGLYYKIIPGLDAVESLPALLSIEDRVNGMLARLENDPKAPLPAMADEINFVADAKADPSELERTSALRRLRIEQRELLSMMLQLLRRQAYQPLLNSDFEKTYETALKARAQEKDLKDVTTPEQAKEKGVPFDPICKVPVGYLSRDLTVPYSDKVRAQVRDLAGQFVKDVPPDKWKVNAE